MIEKNVEELLVYAVSHLRLLEEDVPYFRNILLHELQLEKPFEGHIDAQAVRSLKVPDTLLDEVRAYLKDELKLNDEEAECKIAYIMGQLSPLPSRVNEHFKALEKVSPVLATEYLYEVSVANDYVKKSKVDQNILFECDYPDGPSLEISINLSKPEKNNKDIAKLLTKKSASYPKCLLCKENLGNYGGNGKPARSNIRIIPLHLGNANWYLQYSPYGYFDRHCIAFHETHFPMEMTPWVFTCLFDFVDRFPHFFIGSNSDLPIVGGSILDHEHFQGGAHLLPLLRAKIKKEFPMKHHRGVTLGLADFYDTALRIQGESREDILQVANIINEAWRDYDDPDNGIISHDGERRMSTVTPLVRKDGTVYEMTLILRNNRCDETYPDGIFHAHPEYFHIKHEGIGLIEASGRFILPARLKRQCALIEEIVAKKISAKKYLAAHPDLEGFEPMVRELSTRGISANQYLGEVCQAILRNVAVYKDDEKGRKGLEKFIKGLDL